MYLHLQINVFMGIGLLSMPYAMRLSGWAGLAGLLLAAALFCVSGKLIVRGFDRIPAGVVQSYAQLGTMHPDRLREYVPVWSGTQPESCVGNSCWPMCVPGKAALGRPGKILVVTFAMLEFFGASCMTLIGEPLLGPCADGMMMMAEAYCYLLLLCELQSSGNSLRHSSPTKVTSAA